MTTVTLSVARCFDSHSRVVGTYSMEQVPRIGDRVFFKDGESTVVAVVDDVGWSLDSGNVSILATLIDRDDDAPVEV